MRRCRATLAGGRDAPPAPVEAHRSLAIAVIVCALAALGAFIMLNSPLNLIVGIPLLLACSQIAKRAMPKPPG